MKKLLIILIIPLLVGCYTVSVHTMSDTQLQHEYMETSGDLARYELGLNKLKDTWPQQPTSYTTTGHTIGNQYYGEIKSKRNLAQSFQEGATNSTVSLIADLKERLAELRFEMSRRGLYAP